MSPRQLADAYDRPRSEQAGALPDVSDVQLGPEDYDTFERLLGEVQIAYGRQDLNALRKRATSDMVERLNADLARNAGRGLVDEISDVKLLQGDLAESRRDNGHEYVTVALRFSSIRRMVERATEKVVEGDARRPVVVTERWTVLRTPGGPWLLSAIEPI